MQISTVRKRHVDKSPDDIPLVGRARTGSEAAIRTLIKRHNRLLFRVARGVSESDHEAEDIVQETWVKAFTRLDSFRGESRFSTWLTRIAINEAHDRRRKVRPAVELSVLDGAEAGLGGNILLFSNMTAPTNPESETARGEVRGLLERAVAHLPPEFRSVFLLRDIEGLDTEETGRILSVREETVRSRLHRARRMLRSEIERTLSHDFRDLFPFDGIRCAYLANRVLSQLKGCLR